MSSIIRMHWVSGGGDDSPPCYVLQIDEFRFLLDCGWDEHFSMDFIEELKKHVNNIDAVLITHSDPDHLGALPYAVGKLGLNCPIYATLPVYKMGQMFMYDLYQCHRDEYDFDLFTLDDVDAAFDRMVQLKYNQSVEMKGKGQGIRITPLRAGHLLGGAMWRITAPGDEHIVYAPDFNCKRERHLDPADWTGVPPSALLLLGGLHLHQPPARRRLRDEQLTATLLRCVRAGGCALVACDSAGRALELAHMLDSLWRNRESGLLAYGVALASHHAHTVLEFARSQVEWCASALAKAFEGARSNPFALRHVRPASSAAEALRQGARVVLAAPAALDCGASRELFVSWASQPNNAIVLTARTRQGTLARSLLDGATGELELLVRKRVRLAGPEIRALHEARAVPSSDSDSDSDGELEAKILTGRHDIVVRRTGPRRHAMFPHRDERHRYDNYGEIIKPEDYRLAEVMETEEVAPQPPVKEEEEEWVEPLSRCVVEKRVVPLQASVSFVELEGRCDADSLRRLVAATRPRKVVALRQAYDTLKPACAMASVSLVGGRRGDVCDVSSEARLWGALLPGAALAQVSWRAAGELRLARLSARLGAACKGQLHALQPTHGANGAPGRATFVNTLALAELRRGLAKAKLAAELRASELRAADGTVAITKVDGGVMMEGVLSEDYFRVRDVLYDQFAIV